jgi:hypothetical protein
LAQLKCMRVFSYIITVMLKRKIYFLFGGLRLI